MQTVGEIKEFFKKVPDGARVRFYYDGQIQSLVCQIDYLKAKDKHMLHAFKVNKIDPREPNFETPPEVFGEVAK
jgi:hypothetical protein